MPLSYPSNYTDVMSSGSNDLPHSYFSYQQRRGEHIYINPFMPGDLSLNKCRLDL